MGKGKDEPPALPKTGGNHEQFLTEIMERMERMEAVTRRAKVLEDLQLRVEKLEEAAANAAAAPASPDMEMVTAQDAALIKAFIQRKMDELMCDFLRRHPHYAEYLSTSGMCKSLLMDALPSQLSPEVSP